MSSPSLPQNPTKLQGYEFWHSIGSPQCVVAPMVDQSELPFRLLCQRYGANAAYSPMLHARLYATDPKFRDRMLSSCPQDRPLFVQLCGHDPDTLLTAARMVEDTYPSCHAIDINLGCPQRIAKRGRYGSFLMEELDVVRDLVHTLHTGLRRVPVTCKIRIFPERERTLAYATMLEEAGCQVLGIHGRTRTQKGPKMGLADWDIIREIKQRLHIPVIANGNIQSWDDVQRCLEYTGVDAVMSADGLLHNPALFVRRLGTAGEALEHTWEEGPWWQRSMQLAREYLEICEEHPTAPACMRGHLFKMLGHVLREHTDLRTELGANTYSLAGFKSIVASLEERLQNGNNSASIETPEND